MASACLLCAKEQCCFAMTLFRSLLILERRVATLCKNGRIAGAKKQGIRWLIPADSQKPADQRLKTGAFRKTERAPKLPLPIGVSNYCLASSEYYYIDKTMMIKDFIDERPMVSVYVLRCEY